MELPGPNIKAQRFSELLDKKFPPNPSWIEPSILTKGGTLLIGGEAKVGKSFMLAEFARALTNGKNLFGHKDFYVPEKCKVLFIEAEIGERGFQERGRKIFAEEKPEVFRENLWYISKEPELVLDTVKGLKFFWEVLDTVEPNVLIIDPISFMHNYDENSNQEIGKLFATLAKMKKLMSNEEMSIIISHHFGKPPFNKQQREGFDYLSEYRFRGASKWKDAPDALLTMHRYEELDTDYEAWKLRVRYLHRHSSSPPEMELSINRDCDLRVRYEKDFESRSRKLKLERKKAQAAPIDQKLLFPAATPWKELELV